MDVGEPPEALPGPLREPHALDLGVRDEREAAAQQPVPGGEHRVGDGEAVAAPPHRHAPAGPARGPRQRRDGTVTPGSTRATTASATSRGATGTSTELDEPATSSSTRTQPRRRHSSGSTIRTVCTRPGGTVSCVRSRRPRSMRRPSGDSPTVQSYSPTNRPTLLAPAAPSSGSAGREDRPHAVGGQPQQRRYDECGGQRAPGGARQHERRSRARAGARAAARARAPRPPRAPSRARTRRRARAVPRAARAPRSSPRKASSSFLSAPTTSSLSFATPATGRAAAG